MAYCVKCGSEIPANSKFCSQCGAPADGPASQYTNVEQPTSAPAYGYQYPVAQEGKALGICAIVFGVLIPLVGFICGIVGMTTYKEESNKSLATIGLIVSIVCFLLYLIIALS